MPLGLAVEQKPYPILRLLSNNFKCLPLGASFAAALAAGSRMGLGFLFLGTELSSTLNTMPPGTLFCPRIPCPKRANPVPQNDVQSTGDPKKQQSRLGREDPKLWEDPNLVHQLTNNPHN